MAPKSIELSMLSSEQLQTLKEQMRQDITSITKSMEALQEASSCYRETKFALDSFSKISSNDEMLVPLTQSLFVSGKVKRPDSVLVDIGASYFIKKPVQEASAFFHKRSEKIKEQANKLAETINIKHNQLKQIENAQIKNAEQARAMEMKSDADVKNK